jgi:hypothetical protein
MEPEEIDGSGYARKDDVADVTWTVGGTLAYGMAPDGSWWKLPLDDSPARRIVEMVAGVRPPG